MTTKSKIIIISSIIALLVIGAIIAIILVVVTNNKDDDKDNRNNNTDNSTKNPIINNGSNYSFSFTEKKVILNNNVTMPIIGLGTWTLSNLEAENAVYNAIKTGFRLIDTAEYYNNEVGVGLGIKKCINEKIISRKDVFITSKIMPGSYSNPDLAIEDSLKNLDVDYIDLMLIHQPGSNDEKVYKSMEKYYNEGKIKSLGISNYYMPNAIETVLSYAKIMPSIIQNENHIFYQNNELQKYVNKYGIIIESWYPFGGRGHTSENFNNDIIVELSKKYNKISAQIIIRWHLQANYIVIPGSKNPEHIKENFNVFDFELSDEDMNKIYSINKNKRYENW